MAQPQRRAEFFCRSDGVVVPKAPPLLDSEKREIYERDGRTCAVCGEAVRMGGTYDTPFDIGPVSGSIDHILARSRGGQNTQDNLRVLCKSCNSAKGAK